MRSQSAGWRRRGIATAVMFSVLFGADGIVFMPANVAEASPRATNKAEVKPATGAPVEIRSLDLREGAPEIFVDLDASAPLVWTSFRNADGKVIIELPNAVPGSRVVDLSPEEGLVSSLAVQKSEDGSRPLTRLVIATRQEVEHAVTADGNKLRIQLLPVEAQAQTKGKLAFEPLHEEPAAGGGSPANPKAGAPAAGTAPLAAAGTPDQPMTGPAPAGSPATQLQAVEVLASTGGAVIRIAGDGEFPYSTFALSEPPRFVVDLGGVINRSSRSTVQVEGSVVERVRVAQFKPAPKPVARVVFDLRGNTLPTIERTGDALVLSFPAADGSAAPAVAAAAMTSPSAAPAKPAKVPAKTGKAAARTPSQTVALAPAETAGSAAAPASSTFTAASGSEPSDLALAQKAPPPAPKITRARIESEDAAPLPAAFPPSTSGPVQVSPARGAAPAASSVGSQLGIKAPIGKPVDVSPPASPLQGGLAQRNAGGREKPYFGEPIDLKVTNADVTDVLRTFAQISGLNVIVQPGVAGVVTAELENVPWDQALEEVLKINNLDYELDGNVMRIAPTETLRKEAQERQLLAAAKALSIPLRTVYQRLSYANADQVARLLRTGTSGLLTQRGSVVVDRRTNALIIKELPTNMDAVLSVVDLLDSPEPQVMIEARIVETTKRFSRDIGVTWAANAIADAAHGNTTGLIFPAQGSVGGGVNLPGNSKNGTLNIKLGNILNTFNLDVALQAAESEGLITILSAPKVATLNNQRATIQSGLQIPVQTIINDAFAVQFINATLRLDVIPQVTAEGTVLMDINISKREVQLAFVVAGNSNAPISTKDASTRLVVRDGGTAVIGGIYKVTGQNGEDRVPGLSNIPIIGHLFKHKTRDEENDELLIFITPRVIKI
ncbi:MAG TPA: type IV pilus secretin PilQ [Thermoanaerobaculia bacterium]|nr:type IV pilus secretin PilQ [Thermoanaerobaculia bacterium]